MFWSPSSKIIEETKPRLLEKLQLLPIIALTKSLFSKTTIIENPLVPLKKN